MAGEAHDALGKLLLETPASQGGAKSLSPERVEAINRWIDNPATRTGEFVNHTTGTPVHPTNHGHLRHNPERVAQVFSGDGTVGQAELNVARLHKIADVAANKAGVDGENITGRMRREANQVIAEVERTRGLPKELPVWVDRRGSLSVARESIRATDLPTQQMRAVATRVAVLRGPGARGIGMAGSLLGVWFAMQEGQSTWDAFGNLADDPASLHEWMVVSQHASLLGSMGAFATSEAASCFARSGLARVSQRMGWTGLALYEGFCVLDWQTGGMTTRQFVVSQAGFLGGVGVGAAGAIVGASVGTLGGPLAPVTVPVGSCLGGLAGAYWGSKGVTLCAESWYAKLDEAQQLRVDAHVYQVYYNPSAPPVVSETLAGGAR